MEPPSATRSRQDYIDNLRWSAILLVLAVHAAIPYSHLGPWYVYDPRKPSPFAFQMFLAFEANAQAFFMGLLFFLAGYFVPASYDRKGMKGFLRERFIRLGMPAFLFMIVVQPLIVFYLMRLWPDGFWQGYLHRYLLTVYFPSGSGPMWFTIALLIFSCVYALLRRLHISFRPPLPENAAGVAAAGLGIAVLAYLIRTVLPIGTSVLNMQLCFFAQYMALFWLGAVTARRRWLDRLPDWSPWMGWTAAAAVPAAWLALVAFAGVGRGNWAYLGKGTWESAAYALWESLDCVFLCVALLALYRKHLNIATPLTRFLTGNAFGVYVFHTPILVALTVAMNGQDWSPGTKFALTFIATTLLSFGFVHFVARRIPGLRLLL